jgi:hypothetical protein
LCGLRQVGTLPLRTTPPRPSGIREYTMQSLYTFGWRLYNAKSVHIWLEGSRDWEGWHPGREG